MKDVKHITEDLSKRLSPKRWRHVQGVVEAAESLAHQYAPDLVRKASLAALMHDCVKEMRLPEMQSFVSMGEVDEAVYHFGALLHGPAGANYAKTQYGVDDEEVLEAIRVHTTGKVGMSTLDKIVFLADYIEPNRDFPGVEKLRALAKVDLNQAVLAGYDGTIRHLLDDGLEIYELTMSGRNDMIRTIRKERKTTQGEMAHA